jgi:hypothetical protein
VQYHENSRHYSALKPVLNPVLDDAALPHVAVELPVLAGV